MISNTSDSKLVLRLLDAVGKFPVIEERPDELLNNAANRIIQLEEALYFYANPETYFAVMLLPDPPAGAIMEDFSDTPTLSHKPGKLARQVLGIEQEE